MSKSNMIRLTIDTDAAEAVKCMKAFLLGAFSVPVEELTYARVLAFLGRKDVGQAFLNHALYQLLGQGAETYSRKGLGHVPGHPANMEEVEEKANSLWEAWNAAILAAGFTRNPPTISELPPEAILDLLLNGR